MKQWYEELFENYGKAYDNECFTQGTIGECDFVEKEIGYDRSLRILDIGCGTGRHTIELTKRGYNVVGVDLSDSQLERAREKASMDNLQIQFQKQDARNLPFIHEFDVAIMLCEGGFSLMETDEMNYQILRNASKALTPKGKLIFTTLNALFPLFHSVKDFFDSKAKEVKKLSIEVDANKDANQPGYVLTSVLKNTEVPVFEIVENYKNNTLDQKNGKTLTYNLASGATGITDLSTIESKVTAEGKAKWNEIKSELLIVSNKIANGEIEVTNAQAGENFDKSKLTHLSMPND